MKDSSRRRTSRDSILDATDRLLARNGYKRMTIEELAKEVGIGKGTIYLHFESKEDIALSHIDRIIERLKFRLDSLAVSKGTVESRLRSMLNERVMFRFDSVQHYSQSLNELLSHLRPKLLERRERYFDEEARIFEKVIAEGKSSGELAVRNAEDAARTLIDATNSLLPYSLSAFELGERGEVEKKVKRLADMIVAGMVKR